MAPEGRRSQLPSVAAHCCSLLKAPFYVVQDAAAPLRAKHKQWYIRSMGTLFFKSQEWINLVSILTNSALQVVLWDFRRVFHPLNMLISMRI